MRKAASGALRLRSRRVLDSEDDALLGHSKCLCGGSGGVGIGPKPSKEGFGVKVKPERVHASPVNAVAQTLEQEREKGSLPRRSLE